MDEVTMTISNDDADGVCVATVLKNMREFTRFETTREEMTAFGIRLAGGDVPPSIAAKAAAAAARRRSLGRILYEETPVHVVKLMPRQVAAEGGAA